MNIMNKLTLRLLKENKRRTIVTIIGVIISVAMLTAVSTIAVSFLDLLKRQEIADNGEWHALYNDVNQEQLATVMKDDTTKDVILSKDFGYARLDGSQNENKPYVFLKAYDEKGFDKFPITLTDGHFPKAANEIVISDHIESNGLVTWKIGDTIDLDVGDRVPFDEELDDTLDQSYSLQTSYEDESLEEELIVNDTKEFTIVGVIERPQWESPWAPGYTILTYLDETNQGVNLSVIWNKVNNNQVAYATNLGNKIGVGEPTFNRDLIRFYGVLSDGMQTTLYSFVAIIMLVIIVGSVSLIYNAFAISVSERSRYLGMLASVGATKQQKRASVFFEGAVIGAISIPLGILAGLGGIGITFLFINLLIHDALGVTEKLVVVATPLSLVVAGLVSILTIFISAYLPARRASKISAIDAIRQTEDVKLTGKKIKTNRLVRKLFGIEAEFGLKNLKRNKRRYQITVFSLVISIVLFLSVSYFTFSMKESLDLTQNGQNYDITVNKGNQTDEQWNRLVDGINSFDEVTHSSVHYTGYLQTNIDEIDIPEAIKIQEFIENGKVPKALQVIGLDDKSMQNFTELTGSNITDIQNTSELNAILINEITYYSEDNKYIKSKALLKDVGDTIKAYGFNEKINEEFFLDEIKITDITTERPMGLDSANSGEIIIVLSEELFKQLNSKQAMEPFVSMYFTSSDPMKTQSDIDEIREVGIDMFNLYESRQQDQQIILLLSVFIYGFIALISAISIANIFNTISTSISLRRREFAMLKSIGMTPKGFNKMINYESIFYGLKSLLYGIPISIGLMLLMHRALDNSFVFEFKLPWFNLLFVVLAIFLIVGSAMLYSSSKIKNENIIDALKQENM